MGQAWQTRLSSHHYPAKWAKVIMKEIKIEYSVSYSKLVMINMLLTKLLFNELFFPFSHKKNAAAQLSGCTNYITYDGYSSNKICFCLLLIL